MNHSTEERCKADCKFSTIILTDNVKGTVSDNKTAEESFSNFMFKQNNEKLCYYIFQSLSKIRVFIFETFIFDRLNIMNFADSDQLLNVLMCDGIQSVM